MLMSRDPVRKLVDGREYEPGKAGKPGKRSNPDAWVGVIWLWWRLYMKWMPADKEELDQSKNGCSLKTRYLG